MTSRGAPRRAALSALALAVVVLLLLSGSAASSRLIAAKVDGAAALSESDGKVAESVTPPELPSTAVVTLDLEPLPVAPLEQQPKPVTADPNSTFVSLASTTRASVIVDAPADQIAAARTAIAGLEGITSVATIRVATLTLGGVAAKIAAVEPDEFRPFTPEATANSEPLWERIEAGDVAVTHEFGTNHQVPLGQDLAAGTTEVALRVGAFATNGTPPVADAIIRADDADLLGPTAISRILVGLTPEASPVATIDALEDAGFTAQEIPDPRAPSTEVIIPTGGITQENVWDHLALCESSGDWHINTGNGYYGGIQFLPESWWAVGGEGLPHEHSKQEQIYRGTLLWQIQGWNAWPQCARKLGLIVDAPPSTEIPEPPPSESGT